MPSGLRHPGEFCWINILTPDAAAAREFFARVLGWGYQEIAGLGHTILVDGHPIGGLFDIDAPQTPPDTAPILGVMLRIENADATAARVNELGGRARPAFDIGQSGRMAVCFDVSGAEFDVWQPKQMAGTAVDSNAHGAPNWFELMTTDVDGAVAFYGGLFGWQARQVPGTGYSVMMLGERDVGGVQAITARMGAMQPHWVTYLTVADVDATAQLAVELGGRIDLQVRDSHGVRLCGIVSPQGVGFRVVAQSRTRGTS